MSTEDDVPQGQEKPVEEYYDEATGEVLDRLGRRLNRLGQELPDPRPIRPPIGFVQQPPLHELIRQMVHSELLAREAQEEGYGSFDEEDDFEVEDDDYDPTSPWEEDFEPHPITGEPEIKDRGEGQSPSETPEEAEPPPVALTPEK